MSYEMGSAGEGRALAFFDRVGAVLGNVKRRASFAIYAGGLLGEGERKSMEPIASRATGSPSEVDALHQRLGHFLTDAEWDDRAVRREGARYALEAMTEQSPVEAWILDDTGFLKQGNHSVGVQRQYTGSAGKVTNCQIGVSLTLATKTEQVPVDFELYLPESWANDPTRRLEGRIPVDVQFKTKPELALDMMRRAIADGMPQGVVLGDSAYGSSSEFRCEIRRLGLDYSLGVNPLTNIFEVEEVVNRGGAAISLRELASKLDARGKFRRVTWREGTRQALSARFAVRRVFPCREQSRELNDQEVVWLIIEWRDGEKEPANYFFSSLPKGTRKKSLIRLTMQRWRTERVYEDLKGELGLDHFEGRRYRGWHHHVSVAICCYAFIIAEKVRAFFPSARRARRTPENDDSARTPLPRFVHHCPTCGSAGNRSLASQMPDLPLYPQHVQKGAPP